MPRTAPLADLSDERRQTALSLIRGEGVLTSGLSEDAMHMFAVGLLICDSVGRIKESDLKLALADPRIVQAARALLVEAAG
jgi:hypothetical protein